MAAPAIFTWQPAGWIRGKEKARPLPLGDVTHPIDQNLARGPYLLPGSRLCSVSGFEGQLVVSGIALPLAAHPFPIVTQSLAPKGDNTNSTMKLKQVMPPPAHPPPPRVPGQDKRREDKEDSTLGLELGRGL